MLCKRNVLAAAVSVGLLSIAAAASAAPVVGGGSTLAQPFYNQIFPLISPNTFSYTGIGSGAGKAAFLTDNPQATAASPLIDNLTGGSGLAWPTTQTVHLAGSDSVLAQTELDTYKTQYQGTSTVPPTIANYGPLIQIPVVGTPVTIPFNNAGGALNLPIQTVCGIFSGRITTWSEARGGAAGPTQDLFIVYRQDSSGTSELLTRFLNASCHSEPGGNTFAVTTTFASSFSGGLPPGAVAATGSPGVASAVSGVVGRIGYVSPDQDANVADTTKVAQVNGISPTPNQTTAALGTAAAPSGTARANPIAWVPTYGGTVPLPAHGYPIVGFTNLVVGQCYKDAGVASNVKTVLQDLANNTFSSQITANSFVAMPTAFRSAILDAFVNNTSGANLDINNANVCNSIGRPL